MKLTITAETFEDRPDGLYYLGPLDLGKGLVASDRFVFEGPADGGSYRVSLRDGEGEETEAEWGSSAVGDPEEAWRYALGAAIGPYDYDEPSITLTWEEKPAEGEPDE